MTKQPDRAPTWFSQEIRTGLASLYVLCLDGSPAADVVGATTDLWIRVLWTSGRRQWHAEADGPCIRAAFAQLSSSCHRWPAPARFWEVLPQRAPPTDRALPAKVFTLDERRANLDRLRREGQKILGIEPSSERAS